jgi:hypothetical protein
MRKVEVLPHDRQWHHAFTQEKQQLLQVLGDRVVRIHHLQWELYDRQSSPTVSVLDSLIAPPLPQDLA